MSLLIASMVYSEEDDLIALVPPGTGHTLDNLCA
jgi:hypothetical protein